MKFVFEQLVAESRDVVFAFFRNPRCLPLLHVEEKHIRVIRHGGDVRVDSETWAEMTMFAVLPVVLAFRHDLFEPPQRFAECLVPGFSGDLHTPMSFWKSTAGRWLWIASRSRCHCFMAGSWASNFLLRRDCVAVLRWRGRALGKLAASGDLRRKAMENLQTVECHDPGERFIPVAGYLGARNILIYHSISHGIRAHSWRIGPLPQQ
jgi:hypothetical protein